MHTLLGRNGTGTPVIRIGEDPPNGDGPDPPSCPSCGTPLSIHQPDEGEPGRLLAVCTETRCRRWWAGHAADALVLLATPWSPGPGQGPGRRH